ncbi:MAG: hypothetical protein JW993_21255 [Sedimentisphaerales bacterium]|nr:hypothetical protein [Sedimentisphaerales bacterium]
MRRKRYWLLAAAALAGLLLVWIAGCHQNQDPDSRQARLAVAENIQLKKEVERCRARMEALKDEYERQLERKDAQLAAARKLSEDLKQDVRQGIAERVNAVTSKVMDENAKLRRENEQLRAEIARLRRQQ